MKDHRLTRLSTAELMDIRDYINALLKERYATERRKLEEVIARIESTGGSRSGRHSIIRIDRGSRARSLSRTTKRKQKSKYSGRKKRASR